jgi:lipopolysaccharide transport system ATP-binding protein
MTDIAIRVENLGKLYRIGALQRPHDTLRDQLTDAVRATFRHVRSRVQTWRRSDAPTFQPGNDDYIWALKDVSFEVKHGQVLGIIGRNGAGKSTLLKILSRITEPTEGRAEIRGRVGSLLEVGTGFHPELTGRENIYLNGAILGMRRGEIERKFDEIVDFSGVEKFIDTPVKHYSSGMYVRLAFAVAAHLEPEILLVDEVLAVGDMQFQQKCLGKIGTVAREGRTVLLVSHNMRAITSLCSSAILLEGGGVAAQGRPSQVVDQYVSPAATQSAEALWSFREAPGTDVIKLRAVRVLDEAGKVCSDMRADRPIVLQAEFWILRRTKMQVSFHLYNHQETLLFATGNFHDAAWEATEHEPGRYLCSCTIPGHYLNEGRHYAKIYLTRFSFKDVVIPRVVSFDVRDPGELRFGWTGDWVGLVRPILPWTGERIGGLP